MVQILELSRLLVACTVKAEEWSTLQWFYVSASLYTAHAKPTNLRPIFAPILGLANGEERIHGWVNLLRVKLTYDSSD